MNTNAALPFPGVGDVVGGPPAVAVGRAPPRRVHVAPERRVGRSPAAKTSVSHSSRNRLRRSEIRSQIAVPFAQREVDRPAGLHQALAHLRVPVHVSQTKALFFFLKKGKALCDAPLQRLEVAVVAVVVLEVVDSLRGAEPMAHDRSSSIEK